ncbi:flagella synthesis protein FlgN [Crenobacter cavernae]|uniref:Flagellar protein FlgN n=1 Tax=Crenobacter cavernae TaxID=2290923 RepID=A0A345Y321_9NEIS|nr:flagellar protein FlgN [Crenobacter cavernae]AXK38323.1 flagellar protein FlgN [Crenobacter cavernae]
MNETAERFAELCREEIAALATLLATLEAEQRALVGREVSALEALAEQKAEQLRALEEPSRERAAVMRSAGLVDAASLNAWLADKPEALSAWEALEVTLARTRSVNQVNGRLMGDRLERVEEALAVLKSAAAATMGYERDGSQGQVMSGGRHLGSA